MALMPWKAKADTQAHYISEDAERSPRNTLQATVFAVYDEAKDLQYIGFSRDLKNSLRTVFSRRPEKTHHIRWGSGVWMQGSCVLAHAEADGGHSSGHESLFPAFTLTRALHLPRLDQTELVGIRAAWFKEGFGPPPGNKCKLPRIEPGLCAVVSGEGVSRHCPWLFW